MLRVLGAALLLCSTSLTAQPAERASLRGGAAVRVVLRDGAAANGVVVGGSADTLRVVSPVLGLAALAAEDVARLETLGRGPDRTWRYVAAVVGISALAAALGPDEDAGPMFMNGMVAFGAIAGGFYLLEGPGRRTAAIDSTGALPDVRPLPAGGGVPVRLATRAQPRADVRLRGFTADSLYLAAPGSLTMPVARAEVVSLRVSVGRDRGLGARRGALAGGLAGGLLAGGALVAEGEYGVLFAPFGFVIGGVLGAAIGVPVGSALAPRTWSEVPLHAPRR